MKALSDKLDKYNFFLSLQNNIKIKQIIKQIQFYLIFTNNTKFKQITYQAQSNINIRLISEIRLDLICSMKAVHDVLKYFTLF